MGFFDDVTNILNKIKNRRNLGLFSATISQEVMVLDLFGIYLANVRGAVAPGDYDRLVAEAQAIPGKMDAVLADREKIQYDASQYFNHDSIFFIGRNLDYALGLEGSLKLKEISYIHSEAYASGELKHGTISLIEPGTLVVALGTYGPLFEKAMRFRGAADDFYCSAVRNRICKFPIRNLPILVLLISVCPSAAGNIRLLKAAVFQFRCIGNMP